DKELSLELGRQLEMNSARRAKGFTDPVAEQRQRPITEHLVDFIKHRKAGNRDSIYLSQLEARIERMIEGTKVDRLYELNATKVYDFLDTLQVNKPKGRKTGKPKAPNTHQTVRRKVSAVTRNEYINSIKSFTKWAVADRRIDVDPLATLRRIEHKAI